MTDEILKKLQGIKERLNESIQNKSVIRSPVYDNLVENIKENLELIKKNHSQKEQIIKELKDIYERLIGA